jgi:hypothetical protein
MLAALSFQQPPLFARHSFVSMSAFSNNKRYEKSILLYNRKKENSITSYINLEGIKDFIP